MFVYIWNNFVAPTLSSYTFILHVLGRFYQFCILRTLHISCPRIKAAQKAHQNVEKLHIRPSKKKLVVYHLRFSTKFGRADGFFFSFLYTVYVGCVSNPAACCVTVSVAVCWSCAVITEGENWSCTVNLLLHVWRPYACNGPPSGLETVLSETC